MTKFKQKTFSNTLENVKRKLNSEGIRDFDVSCRVPSDCISIDTNLNKLTIYLPEELEYSQYGIDSFIRSMVPYARTTVNQDRSMYIMTVNGRLSEAQLVKLIKFIIQDSEFCMLINKGL